MLYKLTLELLKVSFFQCFKCVYSVENNIGSDRMKIYNMICENIHLSVEQVMVEPDISRATVFGDYEKIKSVIHSITCHNKKYMLR